MGASNMHSTTQFGRAFGGNGRPVATARRIGNTVAELRVMARYLRHVLVNELGVNAFRAMFADTTSAMELDASGTR